MIDLDVVSLRYRELRGAIPAARIFYAVKANPHRDVLTTLIGLGSSFDIASRAELDLCLDLGVDPGSISYGNTIKRARDIAYAHARGVGLFAFDSEGELRKLAANAPGASVFCRVLVSGSGAQWPLSRKFGCEPDMALDLLRLARELGLRPCGLSFHVGSQQLDPTRWREGVGLSAEIFRELRGSGIELTVLNLGGGFPARYDSGVPSIENYAKSIRTVLEEEFGDSVPELIAEPGRFLVGDAGVLRSQVLLISRKSYTESQRWVYLDVGRFGGLAETENEAIVYPLSVRRGETAIPVGTGTSGGPAGGGERGPVVLAGPTCDSVDIMYEETPRYFPLDLAVDDYVDFLNAGAYTATYSSVGFNGFPPLATHCFGGPDARPDSPGGG
ncbi:type III PLP-dependent enzyme [Streptomyces sp. CAU 1734]|uniref:type III PLP-dependent enzyme n=1 Tax=Streptomyces sp. CAU 1734 TaxID=3140360 RepID=UPI0032619DC4